MTMTSGEESGRKTQPGGLRCMPYQQKNRKSISIEIKVNQTPSPERQQSRSPQHSH